MELYPYMALHELFMHAPDPTGYQAFVGLHCNQTLEWCTESHLLSCQHMFSLYKHPFQNNNTMPQTTMQQNFKSIQNQSFVYITKPWK